MSWTGACISHVGHRCHTCRLCFMRCCHMSRRCVVGRRLDASLGCMGVAWASPRPRGSRAPKTALEHGSAWRRGCAAVNGAFGSVPSMCATALLTPPPRALRHQVYRALLHPCDVFSTPLCSRSSSVGPLEDLYKSLPSPCRAVWRCLAGRSNAACSAILLQRERLGSVVMARGGLASWILCPGFVGLYSMCVLQCETRL